MTVAELMYDQRGLLSILYSATAKSFPQYYHYLMHTTYLPMYFCENFGHHMVYFMKYLSVLRQPTLIFHTTF